MDNYTIFTKTAKGLGEALGKTKNLSREQRKILKEIDGKASFEDLVEQTGMDEVKLGAVVNKLLADDYIREFGSSAPPGARPSGETVFDLTSPGMIEVANSQLTIGDFFRAMEPPPTQSAGAGVDFGNMGHSEAEIARKTLEQTAAQVDEIRRAIEEEAQRITARTQQQAAEAARREAEAKAQQEAESARQQAMAQEQARAKQQAEEQARRAAEEQARKAAEEAERQAARMKAEQEARRLAEEAARREAEERARRQAEEQARREAEEAARKLAQEQAQEQARIKAEQEAKAAAEARAREEAAEQERARLQSMEEARRAAEARAREEAEARARREAEEQARQQQEEARRVAEEEARKEAQEQARIKAWEAARRAAEELAQREAEEKARAEAERLAQIRAEEEARLAAEAQARRQAEEAARRAAEEQARREAEEQARLRAEEEARRAAEEKARREAEELAKKEAQERARQEAEEAARLKAEEKARQKAEAKARKEAEAQAKREAREQARREAEEKARQEAERKAQLAAEEKARKEAEAQARHEAKEKARLAAEEAARQKAEAAARMKAEKEAEKAAREAAREAEKAATKAAKEAAKAPVKNAAEGAGKAENAAAAAASPASAVDADTQAQQRANETIDAALPETAYSPRTMRITLPFSLGKLVRVSALALVALSVAGLGLIHIVPFNGRLAQLEQEAGAQFGKPVKIGSLNLSLLPQPHWRMQQVSIGADNEIAIPQINATAALGSLFSGPMQFNSVELVSPVIDEKGLGWILFGQTSGASWQVTSVNASQVKLRMKQVQVPLFNASAEFDNAGAWRKIGLNAAEEKLHVDLTRAEGASRFEFTANDLVLPFGGTLAFDTLNASGTIEPGGLDIGKFSAIVYDGTVSGSATLRWQDGWSLKGTAQARHLAPSRLASGVFHGGTLEGNFSYAMQSAEADRLLASPQARGSFSINGGTLTGVDMASHVMGQAGSGKTAFNELNGDFTYEGGKVKLSRMRLAAGLLSAGGEAAVDADGKLNGHVTVDLRTASRQAHSAFNIGGTPAEPKFSR